MNTPLISTFSSSDDLVDSLSEHIATALERAITERGVATLVVSGGSTPVPLFRALSQKTINWQAVTITLADERCVDENDAQSNAKLVKENLMQAQAATATFVPLVGTVPVDEDQLGELNHALLSLPRYDIVLLGMGGDGHTASIFPEASNRDACLESDSTQAAMLVDPVTVTPLRITQTADRLCNTRQLILHTVGEDKRALLGEILAKPDAKQWPISHFLENSQKPVNIYTDGPVTAESSS